MIIVEGADRVGKTTLCQKLVTRISGAEPHRFGLLPDDWDFFWDYAKRASPFAVWDRGWLSELAYQSATGRRHRLSIENELMIIGMLRTCACLTVIVTCDESLLRERSDDKFDSDVVIRANRWFDEWYEAHSSAHDVFGMYCYRMRPYPDEEDVCLILERHDLLTRKTRRLLRPAGVAAPQPANT